MLTLIVIALIAAAFLVGRFSGSKFDRRPNSKPHPFSDQYHYWFRSRTGVDYAFTDSEVVEAKMRAIRLKE